MSGNEDSVRYRLEKYIDNLRHNSERRVSTSFNTETADQIADELEELIGGDGRLDELDEATLTEHPYEATIEVRALLPEAEDAEWEDHLEWFAKTRFSDLASTVKVDVRSRQLSTDT